MNCIQEQEYNIRNCVHVMAISGQCYTIELTLDHLFCTVGCHPTRCTEFENTKNLTSDDYLQQLYEIASSNVGKVVAVGEFGLGKK